MTTERDRQVARETVNRARAAVVHELDRLAEWQPASELSKDVQTGFDKALRLVRYLLVPGTDGCVVTALDPRWIDLHPELVGAPVVEVTDG